MFLLNNFAFDSRVEREASTLAAAGFDVTVLAVRYGGLPACEERHGVVVKRVSPPDLRPGRLPLGFLGLLLTPFSLVWVLASWLHHHLGLLLRVLSKWTKAAFAALHKLLNDLLRFSIRARFLGENQQVNAIGRMVRRVAALLRKEGRYAIRLMRRVSRRLSRGVHRTYRMTIYGPIRSIKRRGVRTAKSWAKQIAKQLLPIWLAKAGIAERADIYHANDMNVLFAAFVAARVARGRLVYDSHELWIERNVRGGLSPREKARIKRVEGFLIRRVDAVMTVNPSIAVELSHMYQVPQPYVVMNCPSYVNVDEMQDVGVNHIPRPPGRKVLLYLGRISFGRGLEPLIAAVARLNAVDVVLMGNGRRDFIDWLRKYACERKIQDRIHIVDPVPFDQVVPTAAQADVGMVLFQNTCLSYYYSLPTKLFECINAGLPVIVSDFPDMARIVRDYSIGISCDPDDPASIAHAIQEMFADPVRYEQMRRNTREAAKVFNWENEGAKLVHLYRTLLAERG
jgi:glycosyltransferase involved in cell wall biosynthesis